MRSLVHVPLEPLQARYTEYLAQIEKLAFGREFEQVETVLGNPVSTQIKQGRVLDSVNRPLYAMSQVTSLISQPPTVATSSTPYYFSDFFTPGIESLRYAGVRNPMYAFLWAQTFDEYDFTTEMIEWMRPWEHMAFEIYRKVFVASSLLAELITTAIPSLRERVVVTGLPFNSVYVRGLLKPEDVPTTAYDGVYSSRFDQEKNPGMFLELVRNCPDQLFVICTGHPELRGTDHASVKEAKAMAAKSSTNLIIRTGLTRSEYYGILQASRTQINAAYQDWVSYTLLEAVTFDCVPVYPNHRSFPEALGYRNECLYIPGSFDDMASCFLMSLAMTDDQKLDLKGILVPHDNALAAIAKTMNTECYA